jgi:hypothetical protein
MDMPINLAPGHAIALIKSVTAGAAGSGLVLSAGGGPAVAAGAGAAEAAAPAAGRTEVKEEFTPAASWTPLEDVVGDYKYRLVDAKDCAGKKVKMIQENYDPGQSEGKNDWRTIIDDPADMLQHVKTDLHYWYSEGTGSEKRKKPA